MCVVVVLGVCEVNRVVMVMVCVCDRRSFTTTIDCWLCWNKNMPDTLSPLLLLLLQQIVWTATSTPKTKTKVEFTSSLVLHSDNFSLFYVLIVSRQSRVDAVALEDVAAGTYRPVGVLLWLMYHCYCSFLQFEFSLECTCVRRYICFLWLPFVY